MMDGKGMIRKYRKYIAVWLMIAIVSSLSFAKNHKPRRITGAINLYGYTLSYDIPGWITDEFFSKLPANTYRDESQSSFIFEQIPSGEDFKTGWSVMHTISATRVRIPKKEYQYFLRSSVYPESCQAGLLKQEVIALSKHEALVVEGCGRFMSDQQVRGEISVHYRAIMPKAYIQRSLTWLSLGGFDAEDITTYPVSPKQIEEAKKLLSNSTVTG